MRSSCKGWLAGLLSEGIRRPIVPCLLLTLLAGPSGVTLEAKDKEARKSRKELKEQGRGQAAESASDATKDNADDATQGPTGTELAKSPGKIKIAHKADDTTRLAGSDAKAAKALAPALAAARSSRDTLRKLPGYTCTFIKQEQIKKSMTSQSMSIKFRREPFSVYIKYIDPNPGREVLFVEGRNDGKFYFREASGLVSYMGTMSLLPTGSDAMKENRYPITMFGMEKMLEVYLLEWEESEKHADTQVQFFPQAKLGEVDCSMYEVSHPQPREPFKFTKGRVYFDKKTNFPIRAEQYAFPVKAGKEPQLVEEYNYVDVKAVDAPSELDFDVKNEKYGFR